MPACVCASPGPCKAALHSLLAQPVSNPCAERLKAGGNGKKKKKKGVSQGWGMFSQNNFNDPASPALRAWEQLLPMLLLAANASSPTLLGMVGMVLVASRGWGLSPSLCPQCQGDVRAPPLHPLGASPPAQLGRDVPNMGRFPRDRDVFGKRCGSPRIAGLLAFPSQPCLLCVTSSSIRALLYFCTTPRPVRSAARLSYKQIPGKAVSP